MVEYFGGVDNFIKAQKRDKIKEQFCINNKIQLVIIKYNDNIRDKMISLFKK